MTYASPWMTEDLAIFREAVRRFLARDFVPHAERWATNKRVDRDAWLGAAGAGLLCASIPEEFGGGGGTFSHEAVILEELEHCGIGYGFGIVAHSIIVAHYILVFGTDAQKKRWLPRMASGEIVAAIAMTEPGAGSDLQAIRTVARRDGADLLVNGQKTFITNGHTADLLLAAVKTGQAERGKRISLLGIETDLAGFRRGRNLDKIGMHASDTAELFFDDVRVPAENILGGDEGRGFEQMMRQLPLERLAIAVSAVAATERALSLTLDHVKQRQAFGKRLIDFQNTSFRLAERQTEAVMARVFIDHCIARYNAGALDSVLASMAKWWCTEKQCETVDACLQLFGGYGYMAEYPISRLYLDSRIQRIYGGTTEIMKLLIGRSL